MLGLVHSGAMNVPHDAPGLLVTAEDVARRLSSWTSVGRRAREASRRIGRFGPLLCLAGALADCALPVTWGGGAQSDIVPDLVYDRLYPYYVERCAVSQIRASSRMTATISSTRAIDSMNAPRGDLDFPGQRLLGHGPYPHHGCEAASVVNRSATDVRDPGSLLQGKTWPPHGEPRVSHAQGSRVRRAEKIPLRHP